MKFPETKGQSLLQANDRVHLPGRLQGIDVSKNRNAGPVKCNAWFGGRD